MWGRTLFQSNNSHGMLTPEVQTKPSKPGNEWLRAGNSTISDLDRILANHRSVDELLSLFQSLWCYLSSFFYRSGLAQRGTTAEAPFDLDNVKNAERQQVANDLGALKRRKSSSSVRSCSQCSQIERSCSERQCRVSWRKSWELQALSLYLGWLDRYP